MSLRGPRKPLERKTPLKAGEHTLKKPKAATRARKRRRKADRFALQFHSIEFVLWTKRQPCVCGGKVCDGGPIHTSHDPSRGAGGRWTDTHPASSFCHDLIERNDFWHRIGKTREEANAAHHRAWLDYTGGLAR